MARAATLMTPDATVPTRPPVAEPRWRGMLQRAWRAVRRSHAIRLLYVRGFRFAQSLGFSITPVHFYFPIPDLARVENRKWPGGPGEAAIRFDVNLQLAKLHDWRVYEPEWDFNDEPDESYAFHRNNGFFESVDAEVAYSILRERKPKRVIEVGGGNSTRLLATALRKNAEEQKPCELISVEPHPDDWLKRGFPGLSRLIPSPVQDLPPSFFDQLEAGDVLFLDSSHVVSLGSDVVYEILEVLPRLKKGVMVHFHDIFMPADYPKKFVMDNLCFWGEQYLLQAFLCGNEKFRIVWSGSMMQLGYQNLLRAVFPRWQGSYTRMPEPMKMFAPTYDGQNVWPCSLWIEKCA
ncbi:MAG TPA: class I SAM-dependent methyltransferase [Terriglobales bacterium]|nr:class I SAM-dependent methyltransferase [Terriglobales bacterium]